MRISVQIALLQLAPRSAEYMRTDPTGERLLTKIGTSQQVVKVAICGFCAEKVSDRRPQRVRQFKWGRKTQCGHGINVSPVVAERPPLNRWPTVKQSLKISLENCRQRNRPTFRFE